MTNDEAQEWLAARYPASAVERLAHFAALVTAENTRQNLIAPSTVEEIWSRHILDSAQLLRFAPATASRWLDVGTGAGFPGIVIAILFRGEVTLAEPRARRVAFLEHVVGELDLAPRTTVFHGKVQARRSPPADVVSARAVASTESLLAMTGHLSTPSTAFILPRGRSGMGEVETVRAAWHGMFHVEQSLTDAASTIIVASGVSPRCSASR